MKLNNKTLLTCHANGNRVGTDLMNCLETMLRPAPKVIVLVRFIDTAHVQLSSVEHVIFTI